MRRVIASPHPERAAAGNEHGGFGMALFHAGTEHLAGVGHPLPHAAAARLPRPPSARAWDFLAMSLAVFGTDRFLLRRNTPDGWTRQIALEVDVAEPEPWNAVADRLGAALRFLTGDIWRVRFHAGGMEPPDWHPRFTDRDCACLFSGGLDSLIGATDLLEAGHRPLLVSQASPKEGHVQRYLADRLGIDQHRFEGKAIEKHGLAYEPSSRARSILFIGYGALAASSLVHPNDPADLIIPENGLISVNPPLTRRRLGSTSTRTTHPHFIAELQAILRDVGLNVILRNPYGGSTKGEMLQRCGNPVVANYAHVTYSCGKGKRLNQHCGRCIPCLIRRAAFHRAGRQDRTGYYAQNLQLQSRNDDVFAARLAAAQLQTRNIAQWTCEAGPLPGDDGERIVYVDTVKRGLEELRDFLDGVAWP
jgi:7-cyano-7-deazaguanine synthase in queuosine biosynthesis